MTFSKTYTSTNPLWEERETIPFNELILSWNGLRPTHSKWTFWVSLQPDEWLKYAEWTPDSQSTFQGIGAFAQTHQDTVVSNKLCRSFRIKVEGEELDKLHSLTVCLSNLANYTLITPTNLPPVHLPIQGQSQQVLPHPRSKDLCSPTATTTALNYLCKTHVDPVFFANRIHDASFDIYGNWILNIAEAYNQSRIPCHIERLPDFTTLHAHLVQGRPVVVSVKGELPGAPKAYPSGHLICITGYESNIVHCIDSAFPDSASTHIGYPLSDFLRAWGIRRNLAYIFKK